VTNFTTAEISKIVNEALTIAMTSNSYLKVIPYNGDISYKPI
jgi:hypothetical protein